MMNILDSSLTAPPSYSDIVVIGGGISGASFALLSQIDPLKTSSKLSVTVLESSPHVGGCFSSVSPPKNSRFWYELGAHTCYNSYTGLLELVSACALESQLLRRQKVPFKFCIKGELKSVPSQLGWIELFLSLPKILFHKKSGKTVKEYYSAIFGANNYTRLMAPFFAAVPSQPADDIPADMLFKKRARHKNFPRSFTCIGGLQTLLNNMLSAKNITPYTHTLVTKVSKHSTGYVIRYTTTVHKQKGTNEIFAKHIVFATPPQVSAQLLSDIAPQIAQELNNIKSSAVLSCGVVINKNDVSLPPIAGIVPAQDSYFSVVSRDTVLDKDYRAFTFHFGANVSNQQQIAKVCEVLKISQHQILHMTHRRTTLPALRVGHQKRTKTIDHLLAGQSIYLSGNYFAGMSIEDCVQRSKLEWARLVQQQ